ncbi:MAG TPA: universal stress protein, partial [Thermoanaerobaculia bacterium]|nr:universal stress protein [Thermoanaerobaculia bacterium]
MKTVVATEDSLPARAAIRFAARLAASTGGELVVAAVGSRFPHVLAGSDGLDRGLASALNEAARLSSANTIERAREEAARLGARFRYEWLTPRRTETIAETISRAADRERADLVVVGSHEGTRPVRWALGSFVSQLVHVARRPVAVVPDSHRDPARR